MKKTTLILLTIFVVHLGYRIYAFKDEYTTPFDPEYWEQRYLASQWVIPNSQEPIGDDGLYAYQGWAMVHGADPTRVNAEMPPLGKYLIGLSILVLNNQNYFALFSGMLALFALYLLAKATTGNICLSLIAITLFSFEPLFWQQLRAPFLDLLYLALLLLTFYFYLRKKYIFSSIFLGCMMSTKSSFATFILVQSVLILHLMLRANWQELKKWILRSPFALFIFLISYIRFFWLGNSFLDFLKIQKWVVNFYIVSAKASVGSVWWLLASGKWQTWWDGVQQVTEWWIGWPVLLLLFVIFMAGIIKKQQVEANLLLAIWLVIYLLFLTFIPVWPRYLLLVLPFMYLIAMIICHAFIAKRVSC